MGKICKIVSLILILLPLVTSCKKPSKQVLDNPDELYDYVMRTASNSTQYQAWAVQYAKGNENVSGKNNVIVFTGSSTIGAWKSLEKDMSEYLVVNRHFSGCNIISLIYNLDVILGANPAGIVIYTGDNDVYSKMGSDFEKYLNCLIHVVKKRLPSIKIILMSIKPSPSRTKYYERYKTINTYMKMIADNDKSIEYADIWNPMFNDDGKVDETLFGGDRLHLSAKGYSLISTIVRNEMDVMNFPEK